MRWLALKNGVISSKLSTSKSQLKMQDLIFVYMHILIMVDNEIMFQQRSLCDIQMSVHSILLSLSAAGSFTGYCCFPN